MKLLLILLLSFSFSIYAQEKSYIINNDTITLTDLDTLHQFIINGDFKGYAISRNDSILSIYYGDHKPNKSIKLDSLKYTNFINGRKNLEKCTPCWMQTYDLTKGVLLYEGTQYTDLKIDTFLYYYSNGQVKEKGNYNINGQRIGDWIFYKKNGKIKPK
jgi:antitoxin component YwqK of YwqJK toxin-antitoxin module